MKIFNFGLPRTGTTSFHQFLLKNNIKSVHTNDGLIKYIYPIEYYKFKNNEHSILNDIIDKNEAFNDLPWYSLSEEIVREYKKNSLFFATTRDPADWVRSIKKIRKHMFDYQQVADYHLEIFDGLITPNSIASDEMLFEFFENHNQKIKNLCQLNEIKIEFLNLNDTKKIVNILKKNINIISENYPKSEKKYTYYFL